MRIFDGFKELNILVTTSKPGNDKLVWRGIYVRYIYEACIWIHNDKIKKNHTTISNEILLNMLMNK